MKEYKCKSARPRAPHRLLLSKYDGRHPRPPGNAISSMAVLSRMIEVLPASFQTSTAAPPIPISRSRSQRRNAVDPWRRHRALDKSGQVRHPKVGISIRGRTPPTLVKVINGASRCHLRDLNALAALGLDMAHATSYSPKISPVTIAV